jgi:cobalt-precorrin 5A hydrolase/precorrin-3B C17-methyltransferase
LAAARRGAAVALVSGGDAGVYGMASPALAEATAEVEVIGVPGVTAALAAAALLGAPLGHDHCAISLSDLLTPWPVISRRLKAAAEGDFVISLYNPRSQGRSWQLEEARRLLLSERGPRTPVGLVTDAYRPGQRVELTTLGQLDVANAGMTTTVVIGSRQTRMVAGRMVTPRGYPHEGDGAQPVPARRAVHAIEAESYRILRSLVDLSHLGPLSRAVAERVIHASADLDYAHDLLLDEAALEAALAALRAGAPVVVDARMVGAAITARDVVCALDLEDGAGALPARSPGSTDGSIAGSGPVGRSPLRRPAAPDPPREHPSPARGGRTRSAAGVRSAADQVGPGAVWAIGCAPTALEELLCLEAAPALVVGLPVGFVGAVEAKRALAASGLPAVTNRSVKGGSAVAAAAVNALLYWEGGT